MGPADVTSYQRGNAIAISTYSSVFNTNPILDDGQTLVLDDAHAGEEPVAGLWTIRARQGEDLFDALVGTVRDALPRELLRLLEEGDTNRFRDIVDLVPPAVVEERADDLASALDVHAVGHNRYAAEAIAASLGRCLFLVSRRELLIRPFIPPTTAHLPFAGADQRVYMSATLGSGGELERAFGVQAVERLPVPEGWEDHGPGRRFFVLPNAANDVPEADAVVREAVALADRTLVLCPSHAEADRFAEHVLSRGSRAASRPGRRGGLDRFASSDRAALLVANRYDGLDLPDEACRLIVISGLPARTHLLERFLLDRLRAREVLSERIRTRLVQGAGRATRNDDDFAAVLVRGDSLTAFCARDEERQAMQPELQAELNFGGITPMIRTRSS